MMEPGIGVSGADTIDIFKADEGYFGWTLVWLFSR